MNAEGEIFHPTAELVRYRIRNAVEAMLSQPPTSSKAVFDVITKQVNGTYFPTNDASAKTVFEKGLLAKARPSLIRNLTIVFLKDSLDATKDRAARLRLAAALNALKELYPEQCISALQEKVSATGTTYPRYW